MAESGPREVGSKMVVLLVVIVLVGVPFARYMKDRLEPRLHRSHVADDVTITHCGPGARASYGVRNQGSERARYRFTIEFEDNAGVVVGTAVEKTDAFLPGDTFDGHVRLAQLSGTTTPPVVRCVIKQLSRTRA
jgi:hypothetical protein